VTESRADLAHMLGLEAADIAERPLWVNTGKEQLVMPVKTRRACAARARAPMRSCG
jgi:predicted PhzF superfamily epimerase YddE/YHI9